MTQARLVLVLAWRSLLAHRTKSGLVGGLLLVGTFALVTGSALLASVERAMESCITGSMAGQLQVYDADARDPLALFGAFRTMGSTDVGEIPAIEEVMPELLAVPGVRAVVPEGITLATVLGRNEVDQVSSDLRDAVRAGHAEDQQRLLAKLRRIVGELADDARGQDAIQRPDVITRTREALDHVSDPAFWAEDPLVVLDYVDAHVAPLASDGRVLYLRLIGTDPERFSASFDRMRVVQGRPIPAGKPGLLLSERVYQEMVKHPVAVALDQIRKAVVQDRRRIADDPLLREQIAHTVAQYRRITWQLDPGEADELDRWLRTELPAVTGDLDDRVRAWLDLDDRTLEARYTGFYQHIAPKIELYSVPIGSTLTLRAFTRSGYLKAVEVPVYGTYEFTGLEEAGFQTATNLVDLATFRELYGKMSDRDRAELDGIRSSVGVADVDRASAEAALFGGGAALEVPATPVQHVDLELAAVPTDPWARTYPPDELQRGLALSLAVILRDPTALAEVTPAVTRIADAHGLQVVDWRTAAGILGQFVVVMQLVLGVALTLILVVALIIVNNAMVMATLDRVPEIGTLRAIGASRATVLGLFLTETALLGLVAGGAGALLALALFAWLGRVGVPAPTPVLVLVFGGSRLYPHAGLADVAFGVATITVAAVASAVYPAVLAARVRPVVAMQARD